MLVIAGERSGVGKTTVTLALLAALNRRGLKVQSFKVGPDYIDPMFHSHITGLACRNLDPVLTSEAYVHACGDRHCQGVDAALVEGVMGLFDGASGIDDFASTAHVARLLDAPILLVLNCASTSRSIAAIAHGYRTFDPRLQIAGVVLNRVGSDRHLELLTQALEPLNLPILGVLRRQDQIQIPDRHLGLIPTAELEALQPLLDRLAHLGETCFDWQKLMPLLEVKNSGNRQIQNLTPKSNMPNSNIRIAIAQDRAFSFYYADNLDLLQDLGAELVPWSPISDRALPKNIQGIYFGGGFPEVFAEELSQNVTARQSVRSAIQAGIPTYAECGGLMYLSHQIIDFEGKSHNMVGALPTTAVMGDRLTLGYRQATALQNSPMVKAGEQVWGHEFHRSSLTIAATQPLFQLQGYDSKIQFAPEGWQCHQVHASYTHLHFGAQSQLAERFLQHSLEYIGIDSQPP